MLAAPLNARFQATVPSRSICGRPCVRLTLPRSSRTLRAKNGPMIVQGAQSAPEDAPPPQQNPQNPFYNRVTELDFFKNKFRREVGFVTVLVGPRNCGKSVSSAFLCFSCLGGCDSDKTNHFLLVQLFNSFLFTIYFRDCWKNWLSNMRRRRLGPCSCTSTAAWQECVVQKTSPSRSSAH